MPILGQCCIILPILEQYEFLMNSGLTVGIGMSERLTNVAGYIFCCKKLE